MRRDRTGAGARSAAAGLAALVLAAALVALLLAAPAWRDAGPGGSLRAAGELRGEPWHGSMPPPQLRVAGLPALLPRGGEPPPALRVPVAWAVAVRVRSARVAGARRRAPGSDPRLRAAHCGATSAHATGVPPPAKRV